MGQAIPAVHLKICTKVKIPTPVAENATRAGQPRSLGNTAKKTLSFRLELERKRQRSGGIRCFFGRRTLVPLADSHPPLPALY